MEFNNWLSEYAVWQIIGMFALALLFLFVVFEAIWLLYKYIKHK